jgi:hypothetical protein
MLRVLLCLSLVLVYSTLAESWTLRTYQIIVVKSVRLMPASFRNIMLRHKEEILTGSIRPDEFTEAQHTYDIRMRTGFLQEQILRLIANIPQKITTHVSFKEVAEDFGKLSHYITDLNDPLILSDADKREGSYRLDFARYLERNIDQFPWIFEGHDHPLLRKESEQDYLFHIATEAVRRYPLLGSSYFPNGVLVSSNTFDPRSLPFGIASLSFNHSISNTVQTWFYIWRKAHGDITYTPFYSKRKIRSGQ